MAPNIFEQVVGASPEGKGEAYEGPHWCEHEGCFDVVDEATYYPDAMTLIWTCEQGHKNKQRILR